MKSFRVTRRIKVKPEKYSEPRSMDQIDVTTLLMNAAEHLGVNYGKEIIIPSDQLDGELPLIPIQRESPFYEGKMSACHVLDNLAGLHHWIFPHWTMGEFNGWKP